MSYCEGREPWEEGDEEYDAYFEIDDDDAQAGFVLVGRLDPKTRMYVGIFAEGPPEGCDPALN